MGYEKQVRTEKMELVTSRLNQFNQLRIWLIDYLFSIKDQLKGGLNFLLKKFIFLGELLSQLIDRIISLP